MRLCDADTLFRLLAQVNFKSEDVKGFEIGVAVSKSRRAVQCYSIIPVSSARVRAEYAIRCFLGSC